MFSVLAGDAEVTMLLLTDISEGRTPLTNPPAGGFVVGIAGDTDVTTLFPITEPTDPRDASDAWVILLDTL